MLVKRSGGITGTQFKATPAPRKSAVDEPRTSGAELTLPTEYSEPISSLGEAVIGIHGEEGVGKTSLAMCFEDAFALFFESGGRGLRLKARYVENWSQFRQYIKMIRASDLYKTIVVDGFDPCFGACQSYICKKMGVEHPSEGEWGNVWDALEKEFYEQIGLLVKSGRGIIFISHSEVRGFQSRTGGEYHKVVPAVPKRAFKLLKETCDVLAYYGYWGEDRYLTLEGSDTVETKQRLKYNFKTPDGVRIHSVPMFGAEGEPFDEEDAYKRLIAAFENKQKSVCKPGSEKTILADTAVVRKKRGSGGRV